MCTMLGIALRFGVVFLILLPGIPPFNRITSDVIAGMGVTDFATVGGDR